MCQVVQIASRLRRLLRRWESSSFDCAWTMLVQGDNFLANNRLPKHSYLAQVEYHILIFCLRRADDTCLSFKVSRECWA